MVTDTEKMPAIKAIKRLKARNRRCIDSKAETACGAMFTLDARCDADSGVGAVPEHDAFVSAARDGLAGCTSVHHRHCPEIKITSATTATGIWAMSDVLR